MWNLRRIAWFCLLFSIAPHLSAQLPSTQRFDVIVIRPSKPNDLGFGYNPNPNSFSAKGVDLLFLIRLAYGANENDISGIPKPLLNRTFDVQAKAEIDPASAGLRYSSEKGRQLFEARLRNLLAERFLLKLHHAEAARPVFYLEATKHTHLLPAITQNPMQTTGPGHLKFDADTLNGFANALTGQLSINVIDHTGILGNYALELKWKVSDQSESLDDPLPNINDALNNQLGLRLVSGKAMVPILVVDSATVPSPN